jgi:sec-independent protein translocase protein TatA
MPSGPEWIIVLVVVLVIFGGSQLPKLARNLGKAQKEFKDGLADGQADKAPEVEEDKEAQLSKQLEAAQAEAARLRGAHGDGCTDRTFLAHRGEARLIVTRRVDGA